MAEQPKTIACPSCGNTNPYIADVCLKCGLALEPIREALEKAGAPPPVEAPVTSAPPKPKGPVPKMPELPAKGVAQDIGQYVDSWRFLLRGMADKAAEIAAFFLNQLGERGVEGSSLSQGKLIVGEESRDYYFAERDLGHGAVATMAVRIASIGTDAFVEWGHYALPSKAFGCGTFLVVSAIAVVVGIFVAYGLFGSEGAGVFYTISLGGIILAALIASTAGRAESLKGFQSQDSTAFQLTVRAALEEAVDLAGISKTLIQELPKGEGKERRVI